MIVISLVVSQSIQSIRVQTVGQRVISKTMHHGCKTSISIEKRSNRTMTVILSSVLTYRLPTPFIKRIFQPTISCCNGRSFINGSVQRGAFSTSLPWKEIILISQRYYYSRLTLVSILPKKDYERWSLNRNEEE
jgi:hypothetical protein